MTASEIARVAITVGSVQLLCDLLANWRIFGHEYQKKVQTLHRTKGKLDKELQHNTTESKCSNNSSTNNTNSSKKQNERIQKRLKRAEVDHAEAVTSISKLHFIPNVMTSLVFFVLLRILGTDMSGVVVGILPFTPFSILRQITARGLHFPETALNNINSSSKVTNVHQACGFMLIYILSTISIKYYVNQLFGTKPPPGIDGVSSLLESPQGQQIMQTLGVDPKILKVE